MRKIGEVWMEKEGMGKGWKVQFTKGIMTYATKTAALLNAEYAIKQHAVKEHAKSKIEALKKLIDKKDEEYQKLTGEDSERRRVYVLGEIHALWLAMEILER